MAMNSGFSDHEILKIWIYRGNYTQKNRMFSFIPCYKKNGQMKVKAMEEQYMEMLKSRKIVHDMKNHLLALKKYTQEQDWKGLEEYLNELSRDMLDYNYQIWTGNHMLDMILNQKEKEAEKQKTQMQISTEVFTTLPFSDREIISLFGNLLDNALEACEQIKEGERWIHIKMKKKNQLLYIEIVNAAKNTGIQTDENFVSKKDGVLHGYGMKNIRDIVEQYNGMFQCKSQEDRFEVVIPIPDRRCHLRKCFYSFFFDSEICCIYTVIFPFQNHPRKLNKNQNHTVHNCRYNISSFLCFFHIHLPPIRK